MSRIRQHHDISSLLFLFFVLFMFIDAALIFVIYMSRTLAYFIPYTLESTS